MASTTNLTDALKKLKATSSDLHNDLNRSATRPDHLRPGMSLGQILDRVRLTVEALPQLVMAIDEIKVAVDRMMDVPSERRVDLINSLNAISDLTATMTGMLGEAIGGEVK
jgi:hypothetical protein